MRYACFSDLHIGLGNGADDGPVGDARELEFLATLQDAKEAGAAIIVSELVDLWQARFEDIVKRRGSFVNEVLNYVDQWVIGNHEWISEKGKWTVPKGLLDLAGWHNIQVYTTGVHLPGGVWVEHGHRCDDKIRKWPKTCAAVCGVAGTLERIRGLSGIDELAARVAGWLGGTGRHGANEKYLMPIAKEAMKHDCRFAVFGHTHQFMPLTEIWSGGLQIGNAGTWTNGKRDVLFIDT